MEFKTFTILDEDGRVVRDAQVYVRPESGEALASVFDIDGNELTQPLATNARGQVSFARDTSSVDISAIKSGEEIRLQRVQFLNAVDTPGDYGTREAFKTALSRGLTKADGKVVFSGGLAYQRQSGADAISDLPGWVPAGEAFLTHWGADVTGAADCSAALQAAIDYVGDGMLRIPDGFFRIESEIVIDSTSNLRICGDSESTTTLVLRGTPAKTVRTYREWRSEYDDGDYSASSDDALACGLVILSPNVTIENLEIYGQYSTGETFSAPFSSYPITPTWDTGIFIGASQTTLRNVQVTGFLEHSGILINGSQPAGGVERTHMYNVRSQGRWGLRILGPKGQDDGAGSRLDLAENDTRCNAGISDTLAVGCYFGSNGNTSISTNLGSRRVRYDSTDAGALEIDGQVRPNSAKRIQGFRFIGTRFSTPDPYMWKLDFANRVEFIGCHSEPRGGSFDTDGTTALSAGADFDGLVSTKETTNLKILGGNKSGEPDNLTYFDGSTQLVTTFGWDGANGDMSTLIAQDAAEGTWTPVVRGQGTAGSPVYTSTATWSRQGSLVSIQVRIALTDKGGMAGNFLIGGLPFRALDDGNSEYAIPIGIATGVTFGGMLTGFINDNADEIQFYDLTSGGGAANITASDVSDTTVLSLSGTYRTYQPFLTL